MHQAIISENNLLCKDSQVKMFKCKEVNHFFTINEIQE